MTRATALLVVVTVVTLLLGLVFPLGGQANTVLMVVGFSAAVLVSVLDRISRWKRKSN